MATAAATGRWDNSRSAAGKSSPWLMVAIISIPTFMEVLDTSIANVSLAHIAGGLSISLDQATWVLTSYLVANAIIIPISGWLSDVIGRKRYFLISIALFTGSSLLCGISPNLTTLVIARILQGIGGGGLAPVEQSMIADTFPPQQRGMAFAAFAIVVVVAPVLGPTIGGYITDTFSWHWVFLINVPVGLAAFFASQLIVDEPKQVVEDRHQLFKRGIRIDYIGVILVVLGLGCLELTLDRGERLDWFSSGFIVSTAVISVSSLIFLVIWEWHHDDPVVDVKLLANRSFSAVLLIMATTGMILFATTQLIPQMLQQVMGYTAFNAGLALTAGGVATLIGVPIAGKLSGMVDVRLLLFPALLVQAAALWNLAHFTAEISFWDAAVARLYQAAALPFLFVPISAAAYVGIPPNKTAQVSSLLNVSRNLGGTIGIAIAQVMLAGALQVRQSRLTENLNPLNPNYTDWVGAAGGIGGGPAGGAAGGGDAPLATLGLLYQQVQQQAAMLAFLDVYWKIMIIVLVMSPLVFLMKKTKSNEGGGMAH